MLKLSQSPPRTPPHSLEAEQAILGSVFIRASAFDDMMVLRTDDFFIPAHREIFESMWQLQKRGRAIDVLTVADQLKANGMLSRLDGGPAYLNDLANAVPTAENVRHYVKLVAGKASLRRLIAVAAEISSSAYGDVEDVPAFIAEQRAKLAEVEVAGDEDVPRIGQVVDRVIDGIEKRGQNPERYMVRTGIGSLDTLISGMFPGEVVIVAANPSKGKTALAVNTMVRIANRGVPGRLFSLEMTTAKIVERCLAFEARVDGRSIQQGKLVRSEWDRVQAAGSRWFNKNLPLWIDDRMYTADRLCAVVRRWRAKCRAERLAAGMPEEEAELAVVGIDYLGLVKSRERSENRRMEVAQMSRAFKQLAKDEHLVVIECAQLNRANMKDQSKPREPILSDLRDAGEIEQDGDTIMFPWWEGDPPLHGETPDDPPPAYAADIIVRKARNGPTGHAKVWWERQYMTFSDRSPDADEP